MAGGLATISNPSHPTGSPAFRTVIVPISLLSHALHCRLQHCHTSFVRIAASRIERRPSSIAVLRSSRRGHLRQSNRHSHPPRSAPTTRRPCRSLRFQNALSLPHLAIVAGSNQTVCPKTHRQARSLPSYSGRHLPSAYIVTALPSFLVDRSHPALDPTARHWRRC